MSARATPTDPYSINGITRGGVMYDPRTGNEVDLRRVKVRVRDAAQQTNQSAAVQADQAQVPKHRRVLVLLVPGPSRQNDRGRVPLVVRQRVSGG